MAGVDERESGCCSNTAAVIVILRPISTSKYYTTFSNGCLGSHNDEERSEMRYVMRIAGPRESSKF